MAVWTGSGLYALFGVVFIATWLLGSDLSEREAATPFFLVTALVLLILGVALERLSNYLHEYWQDEKNRGMGYAINYVFAMMKCDFSAPPTVFFIPFPLLSVVSLLIAFVMWAGIFG